MSLWTPYADAPLDLSKVKQERQTPEVTRLDYYNSGYQQQFAPEMPRMTPVQQGFVPYYPGYYPQFVPTAQMSPVSAGSTCSGCELAPSAVNQRPPTLSPPESPQCRQSYPLDTETLSDDPDFQAFERDALRAMAEKNGGSLLGNNPRMRRAVQPSLAADDAYRRQRARNNHAAKQSRDRRKLREIHLALKVAFLKNELTKLKTQLSTSVCSRCRRGYGDC